MAGQVSTARLAGLITVRRDWPGRLAQHVWLASMEHQLDRLPLARLATFPFAQASIACLEGAVGLHGACGQLCSRGYHCLRRRRCRDLRLIRTPCRRSQPARLLTRFCGFADCAGKGGPLPTLLMLLPPPPPPDAPPLLLMLLLLACTRGE